MRWGYVFVRRAPSALYICHNFQKKGNARDFVIIVSNKFVSCEKLMCRS